MKKIILLLMLVWGGFWVWHIHFRQPETVLHNHHVLQQSSVLAKIRELNQLQSTSFHIETIIKTEKQGNWFALWQDSQTGLFVAKGQVQAGLNLNEIKSSDIHILPDTVVINLPPIRIQNVQLDNMEVFDIKTGLFNVYHPDLSVLDTVQLRAKQQILNQACQNGILQHAQQRSADQIAQLFAMANVKVSVYPSASVGECKLAA